MRCAAGLVVVVVVGCGDNTSAVGLEVTFDGSGVSALLAYREGDGPWRAPALVSEDEHGQHYVLDVVDEYEVVSVCSAVGGQIGATELFGTRADGDVSLVCSTFASRAPLPAVAVTGEMAQPGSVFMESQDLSHTRSQTAPWSFVLAVPPGTHDFIATGQDRAPGAERMVIRRDQLITEATVLPSVDLVSEGIALTPLRLVVKGADAGDFVTSIGYLCTAHGQATLPTSNAALLLVPASALVPTDTQELHIDAAMVPLLNDPPARSYFRDVATEISDTGPSTFQLMPKLDGLSYVVRQDADRDVVGTWDQIPISSYTDVGFSASTCTGSQNVVASQAWLGIHGNRLTFDTSAPGFQDSWRVDLAAGYGACFSVVDRSDGMWSATAVCDDHPGRTPSQVLCRRPPSSMTPRWRLP